MRVQNYIILNNLAKKEQTFFPPMTDPEALQRAIRQQYVEQGTNATTRNKNACLRLIICLTQVTSPVEICAKAFKRESVLKFSR